MRRAATVVSMLVLVAPLAAQVATPRQIGGVGIAVFEDANYRGRNATFTADIADLGRSGLDRRISSLRVAPGEMWEGCSERNFRGRCQVFSQTEPDLRRVSWNDAIRSLRRYSGAGGGYPPTYPPPVYPPTQPGPPLAPGAIALYPSVNFFGTAQTFSGPEPDLRRFGFDNRARSLRLGGGTWEVCQDRNFRDCRTVSGDIANLSSVGLAGRISSLRPRAGYPGGPYPPTYPPTPYPPTPPGGGYPGEVRLVLYDNRDFRGRAQDVYAPAVTLYDFARRAESAQVMGGTWLLCDGANFTGTCRTITASVLDLGQIGLRNRVMSARPLN
jgi:hypothetical protein